jgi:hypothetical protein
MKPASTQFIMRVPRAASGCDGARLRTVVAAGSGAGSTEPHMSAGAGVAGAEKVRA